MPVNRISIKQEDNYVTVIYPHFTSDREPKGSVVVLHGMAEHHERYNNFAGFLNRQGYDVFLYDHRGHGLDKKIEDLGYFSEHDGYKKVICDAIAVLKYVKGANRGAKLVLFGHSMGSIIARNVIQYYDAMDCCIISGTGNPQRLRTVFGLLMSSVIKTFKGGSHRSLLMNKLTVGSKKYTQISTRTAYDWLTRDNHIVGSYINDPFCGFVCTTSFYHDLVKLAWLASRGSLIRRTRRDLPVLFISGSVDPVGGYAKEVVNLFSAYQRYGFENVDCTIYEECRHELLNEINSEEIMLDIVKWLDETKVKENSQDIHDTELFIKNNKSALMDDEAVAEQVRSALAPGEEVITEGEKKLADMRARKQARKKKEAETEVKEATDQTAVGQEEIS